MPIGILLAAFVASTSAQLAQQPANSEVEVWELARKTNSPKAYETYMTRFPRGRHYVDAFIARHGRWAPPPPVIVPPAPPAPPAPIAPCTQLLIDHALKRVASEEALAFRAAERANRIGDFQEFIEKFPTGVCRDQVARKIRTRESRKDKFPTVAGFGPLAAHRLTTNFVIEADYPVDAMQNGEEGQVTVDWDVTEDGFAESCRVVRSSGSTSLDEVTCRIVAVRFRYDPARDSAGKPVRAKDSLTITWSLSDDELPSPRGAEAGTVGNKSSN